MRRVMLLGGAMHRLASYAFHMLPWRVRANYWKVRTKYKKHSAEMAFWKSWYSKYKFDNSFYKHFYTSYFGIDGEEYKGRAILDIGCGPQGTLEWADEAKERVGLDPLVKQYRKLGIGAHRMRYVCAPSEKIPFPSQHFDFVTSFNSLDHVDNVDKTLSEIARVLKNGGTLLLITEIHHLPTACEPHTLTEELVDRLSRDFTPVTVSFAALRSDHAIYKSLLENVPYIRGPKPAPGLLSARLTKKCAADAVREAGSARRKPYG